MSGLFNFENPLISGIFKLVNMVVLSALWAVFCIPVFTAGASTTALYYTVQKTIKNERGDVWPCFWQSFKQNFRQCTIITLIFLAIALIFMADISAVGALENAGKLHGYLAVIFKVILVIMCLYAFWIFAYIARFQCTVKEALKNAALMAVMHFPVSVLTGIVGAGAIFLIWLIKPLLFLVPVLSVLLMSLLTERVFRRYMTEEDRKLEDELNMRWNDHSSGKHGK